MNETFELDNNNSIPYGAINWNNEALVSTYAQIEQRDRQRLERDVQIHQRRQQILPNVQTRLTPDASSTAVDRNDHELPEPSSVGNTTVNFAGISRIATNILNFRPPGNEPQSTFTNRLNGLSRNDTNGYSSQPAPPDFQNVPGAGCQINIGMQSINTERDSFASELDNSCGLSTRENEHHVKRKNLVDIDDDDDDEKGPSKKQFLTEEKMAARMYNLRISNDHSYATNGLPSIPTVSSSLGQASRNGRVKQQKASVIRSKQNSLIGCSDEDEDKNESNRSAPGTPTFQFAPGIKPHLPEFGSFLPDEIFKSIAQSCFAIVPWKPPLQLAEHFCEEQSNLETTDCRENQKVEEEIIADVDPVMEFEKYTKGSTSFNEDDDYFSLGDDMDI